MTKNLNWSREHGRFVVDELGLATVNLHAKFEVSTFTHYEDMESDENSKVRVVWRLRSHPGHQQQCT